MSIVSALAIRTGLRDETVTKVMLTAPSRYKVYYIPKRSGGRREIAQPAPEVKVLQRALMDMLLTRLPVHDAAAAYRTGRSIRDNAALHAGDGPILKMDFSDFFPSIRSTDWAKYCEATNCLTDPRDIHLTSLLLFKRVPGSTVLRLAIGAPSSPMLSNALLYDFDARVSAAVAKDRVRYSRYADDLTFSAPRTGYLNGVQEAVRAAIHGLAFPKLAINERKTNYATRKYSRRVTGLVLANDGRVTIGRDRKRIVSAAVCNAQRGMVPREQLQVLAGVLAHINAVEPEFLDVLRRRYGTEIVATIQRTVVIPAPRAHWLA